MNLSHSVALVTGANRGIGRELVIKLLAANVSKVYVMVRNPHRSLKPPPSIRHGLCR